MSMRLNQKQAFWEMPRNIAILLASVATIVGVAAGLVGFRLGQTSSPVFPPGTVITIPPAR